jgi:cell division protein FtsW
MRKASTAVSFPGSPLAALGLTLLAIGLVAISSASVGYGEHHFGNPWHLTLRHGFYLAIAGLSASLAYMIPVEAWQRTSPWWLLGSIGLLLLVLVPGIGREVNGSQRWLPLGPITVQPSEIAKFAMVLYVSGYLVRHREAFRSNWIGLAKPVGLLSLIVVLLLAEPDFGATVIVVGTVFGMLFMAGARLRYVIALVAFALSGLAVLLITAPYRLKRLTAYLDPWEDPYGAGYQPIQSLIAFGRGEWFGVGLGNSVQKLLYLPEAHTDFVFSIWAEETGFLGASVVILIFSFLVGRIIQIGLRAARRGEDFAAYFCFGSSLVFSGQAFVNMGVSSGLLPTKGLTLPFVSYGGSSLVVSAVMLALILRIERSLALPERGVR